MCVCHICMSPLSHRCLIGKQVRRSRNSKKALLTCKSEPCAAMAKKLKAAEKIKELLLKAACAPHVLSRTESIAYNKLIASRVEYVALSTGTDPSTESVLLASL